METARLIVAIIGVIVAIPSCFVAILHIVERFGRPHFSVSVWRHDLWAGFLKVSFAKALTISLSAALTTLIATQCDWLLEVESRDLAIVAAPRPTAFSRFSPSPYPSPYQHQLLAR